METKVAEATSKRLYEDFEPYCKWITKEGQKILEIDLKGIIFPWLYTLVSILNSCEI